MNIEKKKKMFKIGNMSCTNPKPAILIPCESSSTGRKIKFLPDRGLSYVQLRERYGDMYVEIPCGRCDSCIEQRTKSWAVRCSLEANEYSDNTFLTLTYNDKCLPKGGLCKKDVYNFIKKLRNHFGVGIRYFGCGEYGFHPKNPDQNGEIVPRAHYHMILFNFWPSDVKICSYDPVTQCSYYRSKELQALWPFGFVSIGEVTYNSCAYVARYCLKKIRDYGLSKLTPEFSFMSRRPGIGEHYFKEHFDSLIETDRIYAHIGNSFRFSSFRYFDKLIERVDPDKLQELKSQRISNGEISVANELLTRSLPAMQDYLFFQERLIAEKYNRLKRRV